MRFLWEVFRRGIVRILRKASMRFLWEVFRREIVRILRKGSMKSMGSGPAPRIHQERS
jgi:hypothetical protein